ncbi:MAG TPA: TolC family protein [Noviherbaspirillum sp.]|uniref:TolC family protein n=1 Tax=Noviherbaspirillum sp. TaxID=1926288 RepID=UPI002D37C310|nr:TolC family protein [Noviherbaspirillum sp.]HYD95919.1 TolC family protein [Noviherbaspirillum sp.]
MSFPSLFQPREPGARPRPGHHQTVQQRLLRCAAAFALAVAPFASAEPLPGASLQSLLDFARANNPEYASMRHEAEAAAQKAASAGALPDPKLRVELQDITRMGEQNPTLLPGRAGRTRYQLMQELPWFGKRGLQREIATMEADSAQGRAGASWAELANRIKAAYAQYYTLHENERLTREILDLATRLERLTQSRYAGGLAVQSDAIRAQVEQANLRHELAALESEKRMVRARLNMLLARPGNAPLAEPERLRALPAPAKLDHAALEDRVRGRNPQLFAEESRLKAAEKNRDLAYRNRYPDLALGIAPMQYGSSVKEWEVMIEMNIPLQQTARRAQEREAEAMLAAARARREAVANQVLAELAENLAGLESARHNEAIIADSLLPQAELAYRSALAGYENGKVDFATLLDTQRQIRMARQSRIKAQAEAQTRLADIERLLGEEL